MFFVFFQIKKNDVVRSLSYTPARPECELQLFWEQEHHPERLECSIHLIGAKPPADYFQISLNPETEGRLILLSKPFSQVEINRPRKYGVFRDHMLCLLIISSRDLWATILGEHLLNWA